MFKIDGENKTILGKNKIFNKPISIAVDNDENVYVTDLGNELFVYKIDSNNIVSKFVASDLPICVAISTKNNLYVSDLIKKTVYKVTSTGELTDIVGLKANPPFNQPIRIAVDSNENVYVVDKGNNIIYKITPFEEVVTLSIAIDISNCLCIAVDKSGKYLYTTITGKDTVFCVDLNTGKITNLFSGIFCQPIGLAVDETGKNLYVADNGNNRVCLMSLKTEKIIKTFE